MEFHKAATLEELPSGKAKDIMIGDEPIALYNVKGKIYATSDICPHSGGSLGQGELCERIITCPLHGWKFEVENGKCQNIPSIKVKTYEVKIEGKDILIGID
jgi:NAD(P)H-dependent nitrite reductase small subunit